MSERRCSQEWSAEETELVSQLWAGGHSASIIGEQVKRSRGSIIGRMRRLGVQCAIVKIATLEKTYTARSHKPRVKVWKPKPRPEPPADPVVGIVLDDLKGHHCRFPVHEIGPRQYAFCGAHSVDNSSYCRQHLKLCYVVASPTNIRARMKPLWR